jgi:alpha-tubulin suppressor-like RCC1 family protein
MKSTRVSSTFVSLAAVVSTGIVVTACASTVDAPPGEGEQIASASQADSVPALDGNWYRICTNGPSGPVCREDRCEFPKWVDCSEGLPTSCACRPPFFGGFLPPYDGANFCGSLSDHIECTDQGAGLSCACASGEAPLLPVAPLPAYPLEIVATQGEGTPATFARFDDGSVWGWGYGGDSLLPTGVDSADPVRIELGAKVKKVAAGAASVCAILEDDSVKCWGSFTDTTYGASPISWSTAHTLLDATGATLRAAGIAMGEQHACAWRTDGAAFCWGQGSRRRFGDPAYQPHEEAFRVDVGPVKQIAASLYNTCFLTKTGTVRCVGTATQGQLGNGTVDLSVPDASSGTATALEASGLKGVTAIYGGNTGAFCAESWSGTKCWGDNGEAFKNDNQTIVHYYLGRPDDPNAINAYLPTPLPTKRTVGPNHVFGPNNTCAWSPRGRLQCWGVGFYGMFLDGTTDIAPLPVTLKQSPHVSSVALGFSHACMIGDGVIRCWGNNDHRQLGNTSGYANATSMSAVTIFNAPSVPAAGVSTTVSVSAKNSSACGYFDTGINVVAGQKLTFTATGTWYLNETAVCDANGLPNSGTYDGNLYGTLLGRVGVSGTPFKIGTSSSMTPSFGGHLFLATNDSDCANNTGSIAVTVAR